MLKSIIIFLGILLLIRFLLRMLSSGLSIRVEKHYYHHGNKEPYQKPEGYTTINTNSTVSKTGKYTDTEGEYVNYEEVK